GDTGKVGHEESGTVLDEALLGASTASHFNGCTAHVPFAVADPVKPGPCESGLTVRHVGRQSVEELGQFAVNVGVEVSISVLDRAGTVVALDDEESWPVCRVAVLSISLKI